MNSQEHNTSPRGQPALFLDRDGIVVKEVRGAAAQSPADLELIPEIIPVIKTASDQGFLVIVVSNQPDYALGKITLTQRGAIEKRFLELLTQAQATVTSVYYCYHHPEGMIEELREECSCRKPKPGLILTAQKEFTLTLSHSYIVGDRASDIKAGKKAGVKTILYDPFRTQEDYLSHHAVQPDLQIESLSEVKEILLKSTL